MLAKKRCVIVGLPLNHVDAINCTIMSAIKVTQYLACRITNAREKNRCAIVGQTHLC